MEAPSLYFPEQMHSLPRSRRGVIRSSVRHLTDSPPKILDGHRCGALLKTSSFCVVDIRMALATFWHASSGAAIITSARRTLHCSMDALLWHGITDSLVDGETYRYGLAHLMSASWTHKRRHSSGTNCTTSPP